MIEYNWEPKRLQTLLDISGISGNEFCEKTGISEASLRQYTSGKCKPNIDRLIQMADCFAVPLDYLAGRSDNIQNSFLFEHYRECFMTLRRAEFEELLTRRQLNRNYVVKDGYEAPWPYNLLDDIFMESFDHIVTDDEMQGLTEAVSSLSPREQDVVREYYEKGHSMKEVGQIFHVTTNRISQIIMKSLRKLRHPARTNRIRYGAQAFDRMQELNAKELELTAREKVLKMKEQYYAEKEKMENIHVLGETATDDSNADYDAPEIVVLSGNRTIRRPSHAFYDLNLSVRSYNCLVRSNIVTIEDIIKAVRDESIIKVRNLGRKSLEEILTRVTEVTGLTKEELMATA